MSDGFFQFKLLRRAARRRSVLFVVLSVVAWPAATLFAQVPSAATTLHQAEVLASGHHLEQANELLSTLVQREPRNTQAWQLLGKVQTDQQLYGEAMKSFAAALAITPHSIESQNGEIRAAVKDALSLRASGDQNGALAALLRGLKAVPNSPELLTDFGIQADAMHIYSDADHALTKAHKIDPSNLKTLYALAHVELDEQEMPAAEKHLRAYLQMRPNDATAHYGLGHLLHMMSQDDAAVVQLRRSIAIQPDQIASYYELGVIALDRHQDKDAQAEFAHVLAMNPYHGGALTGMGILKFRSKDYNAAANYLKQAVLYAPSYVPAHRYYAMALTHLGDKSEAERQLEIAQALTAHQSRLRHGYTLENMH